MAPHDYRRLLLAHRDAGLPPVPTCAADAPSRTPGAADAPPTTPGSPGTRGTFPTDPAEPGAMPAFRATF